MKQYEIWWASLAAPAGKRPVLLLSRDDAYLYLNKFAVAEITTTIRGIPVEVPIGTGEGLAKRCVANFDNLRTVTKSALSMRIGALSQSRITEVKRALGYAFAWNELIDLD